MKKKFIILIILGFMTNIATADTLDSLLNNYYSSSNQWVSVLYPIALKMYWFWFACELLYQITFKKVLANDVQKLWYFMTVRIFAAYAFCAIFVDPRFYTGIISYFVKLGGQAGGFAVNPTSGNPFGAFSPSSIVQYGSDLWNTNWGFIKNLPDMLSGLTVGLPLILITGGVYILVALMAFTLFMTALEAYIVMNAGVILLGFAGSSWTMGFWNKYLSYVGGIAIRLFVMCLILGLIQKQILLDSIQVTTAGSDYLKAFANKTDTLAPIANLMSASIKTLIDMLICTFLIIKVPAMAGSMLTGTVNSGLGDVIAGASMIMAGAGLAAGLGKMGLNLGSSNSSGNGGMKEAFKDSLRGGGGSLPTGGNASGSSSSGGSRTATQTAQSANAEQKKAAALSPSNPNSNANNFAKELAKNNSSPPNADTSGLSNKSNNPSARTHGGSTNNNQEHHSNTVPSKSDETSNTQGGISTSNTDDTTPTSRSENSGGITGNPVTQSGSNKSNNNSNKAQEIKKSISNSSGKFRKNLDKLNQDTHSGAAEININPHKE